MRCRVYRAFLKRLCARMRMRMRMRVRVRVRVHAHVRVKVCTKVLRACDFWIWYQGTSSVS